MLRHSGAGFTDCRENHHIRRKVIMNKTELVAAIAAKADVKKEDAKKIDEMFACFDKRVQVPQKEALD